MLVPHFSWEGLCFPLSFLQKFSISLLAVPGAAGATGRGWDGHRAVLLSDKFPGCASPGVHKRVNPDLPLGTKAFCLPCGGRLGSCSHQSLSQECTPAWGRAGIPGGQCQEGQVQLCCAKAKTTALGGKNTRGGDLSLPELALLITMTLRHHPALVSPSSLGLSRRGAGFECETGSCSQHFIPTAPKIFPVGFALVWMGLCACCYLHCWSCPG